MKGFLLASIGCLFLDAIGTIITYITELIKTKINVKIAEYNSEIANISKDLEEDSKSIIGFKAPIRGEEYDNEEEY